MRLIGLSGKAGAGKDTVATMLADYGFERRAFADNLKQIAFDLDPMIYPQTATHLSSLVRAYGWDKSKTVPEVRRVLQALGVAVRKVDDTFWIRSVLDSLSYSPDTAYVVTDCRFHNEADAIKTAGGFMVRIERADNLLDLGGLSTHASETEMDDYDFDYTIYNSGDLIDLKREVYRFFVDYVNL